MLIYFCNQTLLVCMVQKNQTEIEILVVGTGIGSFNRLVGNFYFSRVKYCKYIIIYLPLRYPHSEIIDCYIVYWQVLFHNKTMVTIDAVLFFFQGYFDRNLDHVSLIVVKMSSRSLFLLIFHLSNKYWLHFPQFLKLFSHLFSYIRFSSLRELKVGSTGSYAGYFWAKFQLLHAHWFEIYIIIFSGHTLEVNNLWSLFYKTNV